MTNEKSDFSRFGKAFQENLVQLMLMDRVFCDQIKEVMDIQFLELKYLQTFVQRVFDYKDKYKAHPSYETMTSIIRNTLDDENEALQKQVRDYFARIYNKEVDGAEYVKETSLDFCKKQKLKEAMLKSVKLLQTRSEEHTSELQSH